MLKEIFKLSAILIIVCSLSTALISYTHDLTAPIIEERKQNAIHAGYMEVLPNAAELSTFIQTDSAIITEIMQSKQDNHTNGFIYTLTPNGYSGKITLMVGIQHPSGIISGVKILEQTETPGLGAKCTEPSFLTQFADKSIHNELTVSKKASKENEIQALTASTITSNAIVKGINTARIHYLSHIHKTVQ